MIALSIALTWLALTGAAVLALSTLGRAAARGDAKKQLAMVAGGAIASAGSARAETPRLSYSR
ncbi:MAG TPA: hypothetical protein VLJ42_05725 [Solirubrobacteraceae bacterium]|nr:hypothetical protein [Solirubrobacteraceae bacterium]